MAKETNSSGGENLDSLKRRICEIYALLRDLDQAAAGSLEYRQAANVLKSLHSGHNKTAVPPTSREVAFLEVHTKYHELRRLITGSLFTREMEHLAISAEASRKAGALRHIFPKQLGK